MEQSICLDDDDNIIGDISNTDNYSVNHPFNPSMIHSPTSDTLDSVVLEPSPSEEENEAQNGGIDKTAAEAKNSADDVDGLICNDTQSKDKDNDSKTSDKKLSDLSSYFTSNPQPNTADPDGQDFFDMLGAAADKMLQLHGEEVQTCGDKPPVSPRSLVHLAQQQPESVTFESAAPDIGERTQPQDFEDETFESFTAEENQSGFDIAVTGSPRQKYLSEGSSSLDELTHEQERHFSSSSLKDSNVLQFFSEAFPAQTEINEKKTLGNATTLRDNLSHQGLLAQHTSKVRTGTASLAFGEITVGEDPFSTGLQMSDSDRRHDAWIPPDASKKILENVTDQSVALSPDLLALPRITDEPQINPVQEMVRKFMGDNEAESRIPTLVDTVSQDVDGLIKLVKSECFRAALELTGRILSAAGQGPENIDHVTQHTSQTLQVWFCRSVLLVKLRLYNTAHTELESFHNFDTPDLYYEYYYHLYPGRKGSMVPFGFRLVAAQVPYYLGKTNKALDKLYYVLTVIQKILRNINAGLSEDGSDMELSSEARKGSLELWLKREYQTLYIIANILLAMKDYEAALNIYQDLLGKDADGKAALLTGIGRIFLQMGNVEKSVDYFRMSEELLPAGDKLSICKIAVNRGLVALCTSSFTEAYQHFKSAVQQDPSNPVAVNNMAVSSLYLGKLKDALATLEDLVNKDPGKNLHEGILFNLCTLYELESSRALQKKQSLLELVSKLKGDSFHVACLKIA